VVVAPEAIHPADHESVATAHHVEQALAFRPVGERNADGRFSATVSSFQSLGVFDACSLRFLERLNFQDVIS
jgi:hypothetical protein